jgi:hypothetical protein
LCEPIKSLYEIDPEKCCEFCLRDGKRRAVYRRVAGFRLCGGCWADFQAGKGLFFGANQKEEDA